jgi:hypothetical protein
MRIQAEKVDLENVAHVSATIGSNPKLAHPILKALEAGGDNPETVEEIINAGIAALAAAKDKLPAAPQTDLKQAFIEKYGIKVLADSQVAITLPEGTSRIEFLQEAQGIARQLHGQDAVWPDRLSKWGQDKDFTTQLTEALPIAADARITNSNNLRRNEMESKGRLDLDIQYLAVAHTAYFLATGKDAFQGDVVRARGGALGFPGDGLDVAYFSVGPRFNIVSASRSLPSPN